MVNSTISDQHLFKHWVLCWEQERVGSRPGVSRVRKLSGRPGESPPLVGEAWLAQQEAPRVPWFPVQDLGKALASALVT